MIFWSKTREISSSCFAAAILSKQIVFDNFDFIALSRLLVYLNQLYFAHTDLNDFSVIFSH